jgi:hypothetical protein
MRMIITLLACAAMLSLSSCKKDDPASAADQFTNKLTVGTGMNVTTFTLIGEGTTFSKTGSATTIYYRLESAADYGGAGISVKIEKQTGSTFTTLVTYPYSNPQNYGHIIMSAFAIVDAGTYRATGMITSTSSTVATATFIVQ